MTAHAITGFPLNSPVEKYRQHTGDPVQNLLAPFVKVARVDMYGVLLEFEYIALTDAYNLLKRAMEREP